MTTQMRREVLQIPSAVAHLLHHGAEGIARTADALRSHDPRYLVSVARGSSDHVATYLKYSSELLLHRPVASLGPSVSSIYKRQLDLRGSACLSISQSGQSPDIIDMTASARSGGALTIALTNDTTSPLAQAADHTLDIHAGAEESVAATKTFVNSAVTGLWLWAQWAQDAALLSAIHALPDKLEQAVHLDWQAFRTATDAHHSILCLGRGPACAIANEAALKLKETSQIHAESYSSAEVLHGPVSIITPGFPVIAFAANDEAEDALVTVADALAQKGANAFATSAGAQYAQPLATVRTGHALTDPLTLIASFYAMVERLAVTRGIDPDTPRHITKVTRTR